MLITEFSIRKVEADNHLIAIGNLTIDDIFAIHDIKIIKKNEHVFLAMPSKQMKDGTFKDIVHPISSDAREVIERILIVGSEVLLDDTENYKLKFKIKEESINKSFFDITMKDYELVYNDYQENNQFNMSDDSSNELIYHNESNSKINFIKNLFK